ncbi:DUF4293 domain-containing protein [Aquirufa rosea]|uniref:DUF4293 family protein n=1 Tax=Aquirufa rosea TaxID=2509241 RepID=A0A4Q1BYI8_9BACT|nr:DUF4293 domain-containing protein [Aquirufa rosea]RXK48167.1 DUF4293 family protein [Aquirufa rosea]
MIQRPQSIFLVIVLLAEILVVAGWPLWDKTGMSGETAQVFISEWTSQIQGKTQTEANYIPLVLLLISIGLTAFIIFQFKNRMLQMALGLVNSMLIAGTMGYVFYTIYKKTIPLFNPEMQGAYGIGFYALIVALLANMIANRLIRKDEMLVQSSNRMR